MPLKIGLTVAQFHSGNPADYLAHAFYELGHVAEILNLESVASKYHDFDYILCVDSGEALNLELLPASLFPRLGFWFIDYRHNKNRINRTPNDFRNATLINKRGGIIFQSQNEDYRDCLNTGLSRCKWLPLAADPNVWSNLPHTEKKADICFIGHVWDEGRLRVLNLVNSLPLQKAIYCDGKLWKENAAAIIRASRIGFNVNSFYGSAYDYDINMRFFETLSCGVPLVTNHVPSLALLCKSSLPFIRTYKTIVELSSLLTTLVKDQDFLSSGKLARDWILANHTYKHRAVEILANFHNKS